METEAENREQKRNRKQKQFSGNRNPQNKFLVFQETELSSSNIKKILIFSQKKAFLIFLEMEPCTL